MLNKELLLNLTKKKVGHVKLTVGVDNKKTIYGYEQDVCGSLDKVPYWMIDSVDAVYFLDTFADYSPHGKAQIHLASDNVEDFSYEAFSLDIKIVETDTTISCNFDRLPSTCVNSLIGFSQMVGQTVTLEFNPPPDGYM